MGIGVDMGADLHSAQAEFLYTAFELASGEIWILHRNRTKAHKSFWVFADHFRNVIVKPPRQVQTIGGFGPVTKHNWNSREHLDRNSGFVAFFNPAFGVPGIVRDLAEDALPNHHSGATRFVMFEAGEPGVSVLSVQVWPIAGKNVGMQVDFHL